MESPRAGEETTQLHNKHHFTPFALQATPIKSNVYTALPVESLTKQQQLLAELLQQQECMFQERLVQKERELERKKAALAQMNYQLSTEQEELVKLREAVADRAETIAQLIADKEREKFRTESELLKVVREKEEKEEDLRGLDYSFAQLHEVYRRTKTAAEGLRKNTDTLGRAVAEYEKQIQFQQTKSEILNQQTDMRLQKIQKEADVATHDHQREEARRTAAMRKLETRLASVGTSLERADRDKEKLSKLCDELLGQIDGIKKI